MLEMLLKLIKLCGPKRSPNVRLVLNDAPHFVKFSSVPSHRSESIDVLWFDSSVIAKVWCSCVFGLDFIGYYLLSSIITFTVQYGEFSSPKCTAVLIFITYAMT